MPWKSPTTGDLSYVAGAATESLLICSPFITRPGIDILTRSLPNSISRVEVWTKFDSRDWITGATELDGLLDFLEALPRSTQVEIRISDRLHAKFILANRRVGVVGSANLTYGGFSGNIEVVRIVESPEIDELMDYISNVRGYLSVVSLDDLRAFVSRCQNQAHEKEALLDLIRGALPVPPPGRVPIIPISEFIRFPSTQTGFVVNEVKKIHFNTDGYNRTGHLKQAYYAVQRFFQEHPEFLLVQLHERPWTKHSIWRVMQQHIMRGLISLTGLRMNPIALSYTISAS